MASYQASLPASEASAAAATAEPCRPSPLSSAKVSNPSSSSPYAASASTGKSPHDYQHSYPSPSSAQQSSKLPPGLAECPEKEIDTFIGCPIVVLLQHKDFCAVKLQAIEEGTHAIKCRNCPFQTSEPTVMLNHLAKLHKRFTDTQYLCQLNNTFMGQKPVCFGVTGYDELPDGLSDFLHGVYRWDKRTQSSVIVFPCRLCPTCYLTKTDLKTHYLSHQQALLSVNKSDGNQAMYVCRICRQEFQDFISYYDHHMWMRLSDEVLPPNKPEFAQKALTSPSQVSTGEGNKEAYPRQVAKQPRLLDSNPRASLSAMAGMGYNPQSKHNMASSSTSMQTNALNLSVGQHQMSIVDRALTYPVYQTMADKQLEQGIVHLCCPFCQAVYKYRHWLAMHLQNIHGVKDKRALSEALSTSYAKSAANYYVAKTSVPVIPTKQESAASAGQESKKDEVVIISSEKKEELPMPRPDNQMLEALKLMPKMTPSLEQPPVQYSHSRKRKFDIPGRKTLMPQDEDEGIGEMESDEHLKPLVLNMPLSLQATNLNTPFMYQRSIDYGPRKTKNQKSPAGRGRPPKKPSSPGKLQVLCAELAKRVESKQGKGSPKKSEDDSPEEFVTCDICSKTFKHKNQLWGHKKTHSKIYTCRSGKDGRGPKTKSTRLGRRQNIPNFRDIANGKVPPLSEKMSVAIPEKKRSRNTLGSTKGSKQKHRLGETSGANVGVVVRESDASSPNDKRLKKKKKKISKRKRKALAKIISAYKEGQQKKKKICLKEGNNAFYPRRFFHCYCLLRRQERNRRMLANLRQAVLLEIDADTKKNVYECLKCHRYHRFHSRCLQHYQDKHLSHKKRSQKLDLTLTNKKGKEEPPNTKKLSPTVADAKGDKKKSCHYCNTPGYKCSVHEAKTEAAQRFEVKADENGRNFFTCLICNKVFAFQSAVLRHLNTHQVNQTRDVPCPSCSFIAKSPLSLAAHSRVHKKSPVKENSKDLSRSVMQQRPQVVQTYKCDQCKLAFYNPHALRLHKTTHKDYFPYKCSQCPACFKKAEDMYDHIQLMHPTKNQYRCSKCMYSTSSHTTLLKHERGHDREENKTKTLRSPLWKKDVAMPPPDTAPSSSSGMNAQALDLRVTSSKDRISPEKEKNDEAYMKRNDRQGERVDKVDEGKEKESADMDKTRSAEKKMENGEKKKEKVKVPTEAEIIESLSVKFEKVEVASDGSDEGWYFCTECSFTTNVQDSYLRHSRMHERAEMLTCDDCQFPVLDQQGLEEHMLKAHHKNISKLSCDLCQYVTSVPERMVRHKRLHKKMTLQCDQCGYRTPEKRFMIRHILTVHEQQRPFNCEKCNYTTAYKHHLKRHYRLHKQQILQCPRCVHCTLDEKLMLHHIQSHKTGTTNVKCDVCNGEFVNSKSLAVHKSRDHGRHSLSVEEAINHMTPGRQYRCKVSSLRTHQETPLQLHTVSAAQEGEPEVYKCKKCSYKTTHQGSITLHMMQEHIEESDIEVKIKDMRDVKQCGQCGFCTTKDQIDAHMSSHLEKDIYRCDDCDFKTSHVNALNRHTCGQEVERASTSEFTENQENTQDGSNGSEPEKQDQIEEVTKQRSDSEVSKLNVQDLYRPGTSQPTEKPDDLKQNKEDCPQETDKQGMVKEVGKVVNIQGEHQEQPMEVYKDPPPVSQLPQIKTEVECTISKAPETSQTVEIDQSQESNETTKLVEEQQSSASCQLCPKTFETENLLKNHIKMDHTRLVVNAQHPFVCVLCPYSSCSEKEARRHLGLHNYEQQFKCEYCVFSTATASSIATHRKVHRTSKRHSTMTNKRKNACVRVPATLIGNYASGILIDVGGSPKRRYPCKFCGDVFQVAEEWQHHERRHLMVWNMEHAAESSK